MCDQIYIKPSKIVHPKMIDLKFENHSAQVNRNTARSENAVRALGQWGREQ